MAKPIATRLTVVGLTFTLVVACGPTDAEQAVRNEGPTAAGTPTDNIFSPANVTQSSSPELANTAEASAREARRTASAAPQGRSEGSVGGPAATDVTGRSDQEHRDNNQ